MWSEPRISAWNVHVYVWDWLVRHHFVCVCVQASMGPCGGHLPLPASHHHRGGHSLQGEHDLFWLWVRQREANSWSVIQCLLYQLFLCLVLALQPYLWWISCRISDRTQKWIVYLPSLVIEFTFFFFSFFSLSLHLFLYCALFYWIWGAIPASELLEYSCIISIIQ